MGNKKPDRSALNTDQDMAAEEFMDDYSTTPQHHPKEKKQTVSTSPGESGKRHKDAPRFMHSEPGSIK